MSLLFHQLIFRPAFCTFLFLGFLFYLTGYFHQPTFSNPVFSGSVKINKIPKRIQDKWKYSVQFKNYSSMVIYCPCPTFQYGGTYHLEGQIKPSNPRTVQLTSDPYLIRPPSFWHQWSADFHQEFLTFTDLYFTQKAKPFLQALLFNVRDSVEPEFFDALCKTNILHIFSISGMHVMIFWKLFDFLLQKIPIPKIWRALLIMGLLYLYVIATGLQPPAFRAWIMALFMTITHLTYHEADSLNLLGVAGCTILFFQPHALYELSFQLSFLCCLGLILFAAPLKIQMRSSFSQKVFHFFHNIFRTTMVANLFSLPLIAFKFHVVSLIGWTLNLFIVPIIPLLIYLGTFCWVFSYISPFLTKYLVAFVLDPFICFVIEGIYSFSNLLGSAVSVPIFSSFWMVWTYILMISFWRPKRKIIVCS